MCALPSTGPPARAGVPVWDSGDGKRAAVGLPCPVNLSGFPERSVRFHRAPPARVPWPCRRRP